MLSCFSCPRLCVIPWAVACQAPLSMGFSRQEYWSGLPCPHLGDLPDPGTELMAPASPALQTGSLLLSYCGSPSYSNFCCSVAKPCPILSDPMSWSTPAFPVLHYFLGFAQTHVHWVRHAIQSFHSLLSPSPLAFNLTQHYSLFQWVSSLHQVIKEWELQLQHQFFQWIFRVDFL